MSSPPSSNRSPVQVHTWPRIRLMTVPTEFQVFSPVTDGAPCRVRGTSWRLYINPTESPRDRAGDR